MPSQGIKRWLLRACLIACVGVVPVGVSATPLLDQEFVGDKTPGYFPICSTSQVCGQTFTVGITGSLTSVQLYINDINGDATVGLYTTSGGTFNSLLASQTFSAASFTSGNFYTFLFSQSVLSGQVLGIGLTPSTSIQFAGESGAEATYGGGTAVLNNTANVSGDLYFRTFVEPASVPEPATFMLIGTGLAGVALRRRQRHADGEPRKR